MSLCLLLCCARVVCAGVCDAAAPLDLWSTGGRAAGPAVWQISGPLWSYKLILGAIELSI